MIKKYDGMVETYRIKVIKRIKLTKRRKSTPLIKLDEKEIEYLNDKKASEIIFHNLKKKQ